jgi:hypothetical protein
VSTARQVVTAVVMVVKLTPFKFLSKPIIKLKDLKKIMAP